MKTRFSKKFAMQKERKREYQINLQCKLLKKSALERICNMGKRAFVKNALCKIWQSLFSLRRGKSHFV